MIRARLSFTDWNVNVWHLRVLAIDKCMHIRLQLPEESFHARSTCMVHRRQIYLPIIIYILIVPSTAIQTENVD